MSAAWSERFRQRLEGRHPADAQHVTAVVDAILAVAAWLAWIASDSLGWERSRDALVSRSPLFGEAPRSAALGEFCRLLSLLVKYQVGLPEAARLAARSVRDVDLHTACLEVARDISLLEMAERANNLDWALSALADSRERSLQYRWQLALTQSAPVFTVAAGFLVMLICVAFIMPLVKLLNELS